MTLSPSTAFLVQVMLWLDVLMQSSLALSILAICFSDIPGGLPGSVPFSLKLSYAVTCYLMAFTIGWFKTIAMLTLVALGCGIKNAHHLV